MSGLRSYWVDSPSHPLSAKEMDGVGELIFQSSDFFGELGVSQSSVAISGDTAGVVVVVKFGQDPKTQEVSRIIRSAPGATVLKVGADEIRIYTRSELPNIFFDCHFSIETGGHGGRPGRGVLNVAGSSRGEREPKPQLSLCMTAMSGFLDEVFSDHVLGGLKFSKPSDMLGDLLSLCVSATKS